VTNVRQSAKVATITPHRAAEYLKRQEVLEAHDPLMRNRNVKEEKVKMYARDMIAGKWDLNGETLVFASNGRILDGRHRLLACVEADTAFRTHVVDNVPHDAMRTIDTGIIRSMGDQLTIVGRTGGTRLATALGVLWKWEATGRKGFDWNARPTRLEMFGVLEKYQDIERFTSKASRLENLMSPGLGGALWYIFSQQDELLADTFFEALISGANMRDDDPVFLLRERLLKDRREAAITRKRLNLTMDYTTELCYRAWDATRRGVKLAKLQRASKNVNADLLTRRTKKGPA
jgi:hypothetical protein